MNSTDSKTTAGSTLSAAAPATAQSEGAESIGGAAFIPVCPAAINGEEPLDFALWRKGPDSAFATYRPGGGSGSRGGICFISDTPMPVGEMVSIYVPDKQQGRLLNAQIVRCQQNGDLTLSVGARFDFRG